MTQPTRVLLINTNVSATREEIDLVDRAVGKAYFADLNLQYGGHFIAEGHGRLAASWIVPANRVSDVIAHLQTQQSPHGYKVVMDLRLVGATADQPAQFV